jgi:hypothetical protein
VLGTEPTNCAQTALNSFLASKPVAQCTDATIPSTLQPVPVPPESLARVHAAKGTSGPAGRTLGAVLDTLTQALNTGLDDFLSGSSLSATIHFGGLRAGWASFSLRGLRLHGFSYVAGVRVSGSLVTTATSYTLTVGGSGASAGTLIFDTKTKTISGTLGGVFVSTSTKRLSTQATTARASSAATAGDAYAARLAGW